MPRAVDCELNGTRVSIDDALAIRDSRRRGGARADFRCSYCGEPVRPHRSGGHAAAHFEHLARNKACTLSDV